MTTTALTVKPHFGAFILETLTMGMYGESRNAIREYVQNSFDSLRQAVEDEELSPEEMRAEITLDIAGSELTIRDNGMGLRRSSAVDVLVSIGASRKDFRKNAGFRGIGRLAGIVFCDTMTFTTKARADKQVTEVVFDAKRLRELLQPENARAEDASATLAECVTASARDARDTEDHFFEVRLSGFHNPPKECLDLEALKTFLSQVSPLPYCQDFQFGGRILEQAEKLGKEIESIRLFVRTPTSMFQEIFKPYRDTYPVKKTAAPLTEIEWVTSKSGNWWGWVGIKKVSGAIKDSAARGIRVRVRNIQIDGTDVMREIFAASQQPGKARTSYARFVDWYVGEIFVDPTAAVPNARRDGFEEDDDWEALRAELDELVGDRYGRRAYRTSASEQLSVPVLSARVAELEDGANRLAVAGVADWDRISPVSTEATEIQRRLAKASVAATDEESRDLFALATRVGEAKHALNRLSSSTKSGRDCGEEVSDAISQLAQRVFKALREQLPPAEWIRAREIVQEVTGEVPG
jgi:Histidine kinase-, DNA gyrase B-, and HSP90-like ATPase